MDLLNRVIDMKMTLGCADRRSALEDIALSVEATGMYATAKTFRVLVDESAEEFAIQFMTAYNKEIGFRY